MKAGEHNVILEAREITRRYPGTVALQSVTFRAYRNCVNVLIGENGAGKSTLMRILAGVEKADEGELVLDGSRLDLQSPRDAAMQGISIVHQELSVLPNLDIAENIFAGREPTKAGIVVDRAEEERRASEALGRLRRRLDLRSPVSQLSLGSRQIVEIARALDQRAKVLILDEPTSALSNAESESLFQVIEELKCAGVTIIYISHRLNELLHLGDFFTVLRSGRLVGEASRESVSRQWIVERMSGRQSQEGHASTGQNGAELLRVDGLTILESAPGELAQSPVHGVSFSLHKGEILGVYGLLGAGRTELLEGIAGARKISGGNLLLNGKSLRAGSVSDAMNAGVFLVPEDRQRDGLFPDLSIRENMALASKRGLALNRTEETAQARRYVSDLKIAATDLELPVTALSGGSQQKVLIARCLMASPILLLLDEPTRGVDVNAKAEIYAILRSLADRGLGILFASSEIEEIQTLADRALVLCQGRIAASLSSAELTDDALFAAASPFVSQPMSSSSGAAHK